jgi:hypothetical protein
VIGLCDRWHKTPPEILAMPAWVLKMLDVYRLGHRDEEPEGGEQS